MTRQARTPAAPRPRPGPLRWLLFALWVPLPLRFREWVLYDATCRTWVLRHIARTAVIAVPPIVAIIVFVPGSLGLRGLTAFVAGACAVMFVTLYINEATEHRLLQAGYPWGTGERARLERSEVDEFNSRLARWERQERRANRKRNK